MELTENKKNIRIKCDNCKEERKDLTSTSDNFMVCRDCREKTFPVHFVGVPRLKDIQEADVFLQEHYNKVIEYMSFIRKSSIFYDKPFDLMLQTFKDKESMLSINIYHKNRDTISMQEHYFVMSNILLEEKKQLEYPHIFGITLYDDKVILANEKVLYLKEFKSWKPIKV